MSVTIREGSGGEWLVIDNETEHVQTSMQIEGDTYHLGLSVKVVGLAGDVPAYPDVRRVLMECAAAVQSVLDEYPS